MRMPNNSYWVYQTYLRRRYQGPLPFVFRAGIVMFFLLQLVILLNTALTY